MMTLKSYLDGEEEEESGIRDSDSTIGNKYDEVRKSLPVYSYREEFLKLLMKIKH